MTFISTGEFGIIENANATGHLKDDGEKLRFIDVPAQMSEKYGIFSKLPKQYSDSLEIIDDINQTLQDNYGLLGRIFLKKLVNILNKDEDTLSKYFSLLADVINKHFDDEEDYGIIKNLHNMLELGSMEPIVLSLMNSCLPRSVALELSRYISSATL